MILLLSGTSEGRLLGARLRAEGLPFMASVTTPEARHLFAAIDPAPPAFITRPAGNATPTYRLLAEEKRRPRVFFSDFFRPLGPA